MDNAIKYTHLASVIIFLLIYLVKTILLLGNSEKLKGFTKAVKVPEMIVSFLFLATGVYMLTKLPEINNLMWIKIACVLAAIPIAIIGFKRGIKAMAVVSLLLIVGAYGLAEMSHKKLATGGTENKTSMVDGKTLYMNNCSKCHGEDGTLGAMGAADLSKTAMDAHNMEVTVREGKGASMPAYGPDVLTDAQVTAVVQYVQGLKK